MSVKYAPIPGYPGYRMDTTGQPWSCRNQRGVISNTWRPLTIHTHCLSGLLVAKLRRDGKEHCIALHRAVLLAFIGPCPAGCEGKHKNKIKTDNRLSNLYWGPKPVAAALVASGQNYFDVVKEVKRRRRRIGSRGGKPRFGWRKWWLVRCRNCQFEFETSHDSLRAAIAQGASKCTRCAGLPRGEAGLRKLYSSYRRAAICRELAFDLTTEEFRQITSADCHYCGAPPTQWKSSVRGGRRSERDKWQAYVHNGIDRMNNGLGYTRTNCLPCCGICNRAKSTLTYDEFMGYINRIRSSNGKARLR